MTTKEPTKNIPVLDRRSVLLEHLTAKIVPVFSSKSRAEDVALEVYNGRKQDDVIRILEDEKTLFDALVETNGYKSEKEELGEQLFTKVYEVEPDLCAKITGMLLELDIVNLKQLTASPKLLTKAIEKSKQRYLLYTEEIKEKEEIGERLYEHILVTYSTEVASHITGMLMEIDLDDLRHLLNNKDLLKKKVQLAFDTFSEYHST